MVAFELGFRVKGRARRRADREQRVREAIGMLRPERASLLPIARLAFLHPVATAAVLENLIERGEVTWTWVNPSQPRHRLYQAKTEVAR